MSILDSFRVPGKVALVTGAGKGIGAAIALALADAGADVAVLARTETDIEKVAAAVRERGQRAVAIPVDVTDLDAVGVAVERVVAELGGLDIVVNNAGGSMPRPFVKTRARHLTEAFHFNVTVAFEVARLAVPHLLARGGGTIVNISSMSGVHAPRACLAYGTAKAAMSHMTELMAADLAPRIRVNAVLPGAVETEALSFFLDAVDPGIRESMHANTLMRRNGAAEEIASATLFLASPASAFMTGKLVEVDGGFSFDLVPQSVEDL